MQLVSIALLAASAAPAADVSLAIRARTVWAGDGRVLENATVVVTDGRIRALGPDVDVPEGAEIVDHPGFLTAGLVALHAASGVSAETRDGTRPALPEARVGLALDRQSRDLEALRAAGITAVVLVPEIVGVSGGLTAAVRTDGEVLRDPAHLALVFSAQGLSGNREPTSLPGALALLDQLFAQPRGVVADASAGRLPCLFEVREREDVQRAIAFASARGLRGALHGAALAGEIDAVVRAAGLSVVVPALGVGTPRRALDAIVRLAKAGVPLGFGLDAPWNHADVLRLSAALAVRHGLDRQAAWEALTGGAARIAGIADRTGRIERGLSADLVLWSGDPLDLSSAPRAVLIGGRNVLEPKR